MKYLFSILVFTFLFTGVPSVHAVTFDGGSTSGTVMDGGSVSGTESSESITVDNPILADNITELFQMIIDVVLIFAIPIVVFFIIYAGFLYVTARGNEETIKKAHAALLYALIGGLLILGARVLIDVVGGTVDSVTGTDTSTFR